MHRRAALLAAGLWLAWNLAPAWAQANRTFVSGHGSDGNPCSLSAPCRSFAQALTQTNAGGEITVLDPAGYGSVNITKPVSVINDGVGEAGVTTASAEDAIYVAAGPNDVVNLRGLTLVGGGIGLYGIVFATGSTLNVQNCVIRGFTQGGLLMGVTPANAVAPVLTVSDTVVSGNGNSNNGSGGINIQPQGTGIAAGAFLERVQLIGNAPAGLTLFAGGATGTVTATVADSIASGNGVGFQASSTAGQATANLILLRDRAVNNTRSGAETVGVRSFGANTTVYLGQSILSGNAFDGFDASADPIASFGDNVIVAGRNFGNLTLLPRE